MAKKKISAFAPPHEKVEITVSTYWPTRIIKSVTITDLTQDSAWHSDITLERKEAKYLFEQLKTLFETSDEENNSNSVKERNDV